MTDFSLPEFSLYFRRAVPESDPHFTGVQSTFFHPVPESDPHFTGVQTIFTRISHWIATTFRKLYLNYDALKLKTSTPGCCSSGFEDGGRR